MPRGILTKILLAIVFLLAPASRGIALDLAGGETQISRGKPTPASFAVNGELTDPQTGEPSGFYSVFVLAADPVRNVAEVSLDVHNFTNCPMRFGGTFLIDGEAVRTVGGGEEGTEIPIHGSWSGKSDIALRDGMRAFSFLPRAMLVECSGAGEDYAREKAAVEDELGKIEPEAAPSKPEARPEVKRREKPGVEKKARPPAGKDARKSAARPPAGSGKHEPSRGGPHDAPGPRMSCEECGKLALRLARLDGPILCHPRLIALARRFATSCAPRSDCSDGLLRRWRDPALDTLRFMRGNCPDF